VRERERERERKMSNRREKRGRAWRERNTFIIYSVIQHGVPTGKLSTF
jgi:hypothetical protein